MVRWIVTLIVFGTLLAGAWGEAVRFRAWQLRRAAEAAYYAGELEPALAAYERVRRMLPGEPRSYTEPADSITQALEGPRGQEIPVEQVERLASQAARYYLGAIRVSPPNAWSFAGLGGMAGTLKARRGQAMETDLASLSPDPLENLRPADRLHEAALVKAVQLEPRNYYYRDFLGDFYWMHGFRERALEHFRIAARLQPVLDRHYYLGYLISVSPEVLLAVETGVRESLAQPQTEAPREDIHRFLAAVYTQLGRYEDARSSLEAAAETSQYPHMIEFQIARVLVAEGNEPAALEAYRRALEIDPSYHAAWIQMGELLSRMNRDEEAIDALKRARGLRPTDYQPAWALARAFERVERLDEAAETLEALVELHPSRRDPYFRLITVYDNQQKTSEALRVSRQLAARYPDEPVYQQQVEQFEQELGQHP